MRPLIEDNVIFTDKCTACGGCSAVCPVDCFKMSEHDASIVGHCIECLRCDAVCPVLEGYDPDIGFYKKFVAARSQFEGQDGGLTQAILYKLFEEGTIDAAVGIASDEDWNPFPKLITNFDEFSNMRFSRYTYSPLLPAVARAVKEGYRKIAVIGVGCQIHSTAMLRENVSELGRQIAFLIGLVCTKTFRSKAFFEYVKGQDINLSEIRKFNVTKGKFIVEWGEDQVFTSRVKELGPMSREGCQACEDVCAMSADISLGAVGAPSGYNAVLIRSSSGLEFWNRLKPNLVDVQPLSPKLMQKLNRFKRKEVWEHLKYLGEEPKLRTQV